LLREKRTARGLTQRELGDLAHVDDSYISQLERDYKFPSARTIESLARALGVEVAELLAMYFPAAAPPRPEVFVGREAAVAVFEKVLAGHGGIFVISGPPGVGKTAFIDRRLIPKCQEKGVPYAYFDARRVPSYRDFLKEFRDAVALRRGGYHPFDEMYEQCRAIERRLRSRFKDPFSLEVAGGGEVAGGREVELSYAEKYIYRDAERLLTEEFLAGWPAAFSRGAKRVILFLDNFDAVGAMVGYWIRRFWERSHEAGILGESLLVVIAHAAAETAGLPAGLGRRVRTLMLAPFSPAEVEAYIYARGLKLSPEEWTQISSLGGDVRALKLWADYFEAAAHYAANRLALAEEMLRRLDEESAPFIAGAGFTGAAALAMKTQRMLGHLTRLQGRLEEAAAYYDAAVVLAERFQGKPAADLGYLYLDLGHVFRHRGRWDKAVGYYRRAGEVFSELGEKLGAGIVASSLGTAFRLKGDFPRAKQEYRRAAEILRKLAGEDGRGREAGRWLASVLSNDAIATRLAAEKTREVVAEAAAAEKLLARAKELCREAVAVTDDAAETAVAENRYGLCLLTEGRWRLEEGAEAEGRALLAEAVQYHKRALAAFEDLGDKYRVAQVLMDLGVAAARQALIHDAIVNFKNSLALFQQMGSRYHVAKVLVELGRLAEGGEQLSYFAEALAAARDHNDESLAEIADAIKAVFGPAGRRRAKRFFVEQIALEPKLDALFGAGA